jgi:hypothetical protein
MSAIPTQVDPQATTPVFHGPADAAAAKAAVTPVRASWTGREWRVAFLIAMVALVSLADLYLTLTYLHNGGMAEGNPVARWVMSLGCPWLLVVWKVGLVCFTCGVLFTFRRRTSAEIAAWVCCLTMAWLTFQWSSYIHDVNAEIKANPQLTEASTWMSFDKN